MCVSRCQSVIQLTDEMIIMLFGRSVGRSGFSETHRPRTWMTKKRRVVTQSLINSRCVMDHCTQPHGGREGGTRRQVNCLRTVLLCALLFRPSFLLFSPTACLCICLQFHCAVRLPCSYIHNPFFHLPAIVPVCFNALFASTFSPLL